MLVAKLSESLICARVAIRHIASSLIYSKWPRFDMLQNPSCPSTRSSPQ